MYKEACSLPCMLKSRREINCAVQQLQLENSQRQLLVRTCCLAWQEAGLKPCADTGKRTGVSADHLIGLMLCLGNTLSYSRDGQHAAPR